MVAGGILPTFDDDDDVYNTKNESNATDIEAIDGDGKKQPSTIKRNPSTYGAGGSQSAPVIVYLMTVLSAMGGFLFGYDTGIVSGAMVFVRKVFNLNSIWHEVVVSITILGAWVLSLIAGSLSERYGRKTMILHASVIFTIGSIVMGAAWSKWILLFGRLTVGVAIGLASTVVPVYIAEVAPSNIRGSLVTLNNCFITIGQLAAAITAGAFSYDQENGWRWMLGLAAVPATVQFAGFMFMPESPRWLIRRQRDDEALEALRRIRGPKATNVIREFDKIRQNQSDMMVHEARRKAQKRNIIVAIFRKTATRRALLVGCLLNAIQQLAGINTVMYYTATIIEMSGVQSPDTAVWMAVPTAAVYVLFSFCGYLLADRLGRRPLTLGSLLGVIISLILLGSGFHLTSMNSAPVTAHNMSTLEACYTKQDCTSCIADPRCGFCYDSRSLSVATCLAKNPEDNARSLGGECAYQSATFSFANHICPSMTDGIGLNTWLVLTGLVMYLASFAPGMGPTPWTINSEIYPMWARSFCYSIATSVNWMFNLLITLTFISLTELITTHGAFYLYAMVAAVGWMLLFWKLPETRGRSLEDISSLFAKTKKPDSQEIMDDSAVGTPNQSIGVGRGSHTRCGTISCHDNLAFSLDSLPPYNSQHIGDNVGVPKSNQPPPTHHLPHHQMVRNVSTLDSSMPYLNESFKLASPLTKAANIAMCHSPESVQPLQSPMRDMSSQQQQVPPTPPPNPSFATLLLNQKQYQQQQQVEQQQRPPELQPNQYQHHLHHQSQPQSQQAHHRNQQVCRQHSQQQQQQQQQHQQQEPEPKQQHTKRKYSRNNNSSSNNNSS